MRTNVCLTENEILNQNGKIVNNPDGTISVYTISSLTGQLTPLHLTKPCCEALGISGSFFDSTTQKCRWSATPTYNTNNGPFNLILNPRGNDGIIFSPEQNDTCTLSVDFDYLFKFSCSTLTDLVNGKINNSCDTILDVFESIGASVIVNTVETINYNNTLNNVYEEEFFTKIGSGNLYDYLSGNLKSGFYICGLDEDSNCSGFNLYDLNASGNSINCAVPVTQLLQGLLQESGLLSITGTTEFKNNINENVFRPNWLHFHTEITGKTIIDSIVNKKIKLTIRLSGVCIDTCFLIDNIELNRNCTKVDRNDIFITKSPSFNLDKIIDNKKSWVSNDEYEQRSFYIGKYDGTQQIRNTDYFIDNERQILNTKEIDLDINIASAVENDVWCYISDNPCILTGQPITTTSCVKNVYTLTTATTEGFICAPKTYCCSEYCGDANIDINNLLTQPLSSVTTIEDFEYYLSSELIDVKNRKIISTYPTLRLLYDRYINSTDFCGLNSSKFDYYTMNKFASLIGNYWVDLIEQVIPATTIWGATRVYTNTIFDKEKYKYRSYSLLFDGNPSTNIKASSPATGHSCNTSATTTVIMGSATGTTQFFNNGNTQSYNGVYVLQMNSGSEFFGSVTILGANGTIIGGSGGNNGGSGNDSGNGNGPNGNNGSNNSGGIGVRECSIGVRISTPLSNSANAIVNGSFGAVTYSWSNGATTPTINNLSAGTYVVTVYDTSVVGCYAKASVLIT